MRKTTSEQGETLGGQMKVWKAKQKLPKSMSRAKHLEAGSKDQAGEQTSKKTPPDRANQWE